MANSTYLQAFRSNELNGRNDNRRVRDSQFSVNRGPILIGEYADRPEQTDERPVQVPARPTRPGRSTLRSTGFYSYLYGRTGIELTQNSELNGSDPSMAFRRIIDVISNRPQQGGSVDADAERGGPAGGVRRRWPGRPARWSRSSRRPAAILAMVTDAVVRPERAGHPRPERRSDAAWKQLTDDPDKPMLEPGGPGDSTRRARRSSWSPRPRRCRAASTRRRPR